MIFLIFILLPALISFIVSFAMMKFQMRMIEKSMNQFFDEEFKRIEKLIR